MQQQPTLRPRGRGVSPWRDLDLLEDRMRRLMSGMPLFEAPTETMGWSPRVDLAEDNGHYVLTAELPGVEPADVDIEVEGNVLTIRGEKKVVGEHEDERVQIAERRYGRFERELSLPSAADPENVNAEFHQGVLTVRIAKRPEARGRKIEIQAK